MRSRPGRGFGKRWSGWRASPVRCLLHGEVPRTGLHRNFASERGTFAARLSCGTQPYIGYVGETLGTAAWLDRPALMTRTTTSLHEGAELLRGMAAARATDEARRALLDVAEDLDAEAERLGTKNGTSAPPRLTDPLFRWTA